MKGVVLLIAIHRVDFAVRRNDLLISAMFTVLSMYTFFSLLLRLFFVVRSNILNKQTRLPTSHPFTALLFSVIRH